MDRIIWLDRLIIGIAKNISVLLYLVLVLLYYCFWVLLPIFLWVYFGFALRDSYPDLGRIVPFILSFVIIVGPYVYTLLRIPNIINTISRFPYLLLQIADHNNKDFDRALLFRRYDPLSVEYELALKESTIGIVVKFPEEDNDVKQLAVHKQVRTALNKRLFEKFVSLLKQIENIDYKKDDTRNGFKPIIFDAIEEGQYEYVAAVLDRGANINEADKYRGGITSLQLACQKGYLEIVRLLIACGADVNAKDQWGRTPLWYASKCHGGFPGVVDLLITNGAEAHNETN